MLGRKGAPLDLQASVFDLCAQPFLFQLGLAHQPVGDAAQELGLGPAALEAAGSTLDQVLKVTVYASNSAYFATINEVYAGYFGENPPARTFVTVASWPMEFDVEIECIAVKAGGR